MKAAKSKFSLNINKMNYISLPGNPSSSIIVAMDINSRWETEDIISQMNYLILKTNIS